MDISLKKTALAAVLGVGLIGAVQAAGFAPPPAACTGYPVTVPCEREAWDIAFEGFWAEAANRDLNFGTHFSDGYYGERWFNHHHNHDFDFGFRLEGSYHFRTGNDVTVNWTRFDNSNRDSFEFTSAEHGDSSGHDG